MLVFCNDVCCSCSAVVMNVTSSHLHHYCLLPRQHMSGALPLYCEKRLLCVVMELVCLEATFVPDVAHIRYVIMSMSSTQATSVTLGNTSCFERKPTWCILVQSWSWKCCFYISKWSLTSTGSDLVWTLLTSRDAISAWWLPAVLRV